MSAQNKVRKKVVAFVLRESSDQRPEILLHSFISDPTLPQRLPGGGVDSGESADQAIMRELLEETGYADWKVHRKLGVQTYFKPYIKAHVERHDFLIATTIDLPDNWTHMVQGDGDDAGDPFYFSWRDSHSLENIDDEHLRFIEPNYLPELFRSGDQTQSL